jgi:hypothetical protein
MKFKSPFFSYVIFFLPFDGTLSYPDSFFGNTESPIIPFGFFNKFGQKSTLPYKVFFSFTKKYYESFSLFLNINNYKKSLILFPLFGRIKMLNTEIKKIIVN